MMIWCDSVTRLERSQGFGAPCLTASICRDHRHAMSRCEVQSFEIPDEGSEEEQERSTVSWWRSWVVRWFSFWASYQVSNRFVGTSSIMMVCLKMAQCLVQVTSLSSPAWFGHCLDGDALSQDTGCKCHICCTPHLQVYTLTDQYRSYISHGCSELGARAPHWKDWPLDRHHSRCYLFTRQMFTNRWYNAKFAAECVLTT
jgi:hypothetical protein